MSFGYETGIPPIYTLTFFNAIANNGKMVRPMFTRSIARNGKTVESFSTRVINSSICSDKTLAEIKEMLLGVVENGTGKAVHSDVIRIAGKTGTAQISQGRAGYKANGVSHQVAFCGYFPADNPKYSCIVVIRRPRIGYPSGGTMSGGVCRNIAEKIYASTFSFRPKDLPEDTLARKVPAVKGGDYKALEYVMNELDIDYDDAAVETGWVATERRDDDVLVKDVPVRPNLVPNVTGMGAKDAVFLLESAGLKVALSGVGRVRAQNIPPGRTVVKGQTVTLTLK